MLFVRKNKQLKLREMTGGLFTESQLSKFEKGETDITVGKFFKLLEHANIYLDEFQHVYNDYILAETMEFHQELAQAYQKRDLMTLQKWLFFWKDKAKYEPDLIGNKINEIVVSSVISAVKGSVVFKENITFLMDYLDNVKEWGRFEIWIFGNCLRFFDEEALKYYAGYLLGRTNFYWNMHLNKQLVIGTYLNIIDAFFEKRQLNFC
ncbi:Rgg/GadR/MutR family transcriptional regulator [Lactococcus fujiensis]|uniref:Rgg/GadR/MutR family transcriptional regulator n=1 Tax=Lactococcus fujiensis TaxID=610251 RepID=UPI000B0CB2D1|nr:Rgg/GadR/MutR family transcriptional regulator [Lactococcus fujiensis]